MELPVATFVGPTAEEVSHGIDLTGKTVIVTGANSGIGKESARVFLLRGAFVVLGVRNKEDGDKCVAEFTQTVPSAAANSAVIPLDLGDDKSIYNFVAEFSNLKRPIHVLLLNAGIMSPKERVLVPWCGYESQFAINHLGHFLLTQLLFDPIVAGGNSRVVVVSSLAHMRGGVNFDDINFDKGYNKWLAYAQSKSANILFAKELNRRFEAAQVKVRANALHPGAIVTNLSRHMDDEDVKLMTSRGYQFKTIPQGATTSVWAAVAPELEGKGGLYLEDGKISEVKNPLAADMSHALRLWELSEKIIFERTREPLEEKNGWPRSRFNFFSTSEQVTEGVDLTGKLVIVTGANSGIGKEAARVFLLRGADVILAARKVEEGKQCVEEFAQKIPGAAARAEVLQLDLADPKSILAFAGAVKAKNRPIHILMLNAGIMALPVRSITAWCNSETQFAVNHLGHFLLATQLLDAVKASGSGRVVVLSSGAHRRGGVQFDDINYEQKYDGWSAYGQSKTANILFAVELNRRLKESGSQVRANAVHPGVIRTNLSRHLDVSQTAMLSNMPMLIKSTEQGAATQLWAAVAPELEGVGGLYLANCKAAPAMEYATNADNAARLWKLSEELIKPAFQ